jgi:hypothetical protein
MLLSMKIRQKYLVIFNLENIVYIEGREKEAEHVSGPISEIQNKVPL